MRVCIPLVFCGKSVALTDAWKPVTYARLATDNPALKSGFYAALLYQKEDTRWDGCSAPLPVRR